MAGIDAAIRCGTAYLEVDVQLSADGMPMLFHDRTLARVCGVAGAVHEFTRRQLREFSAHEPGRFGDRYLGEPVAALAELAQLLGRHPRVTAFIEAKRVAIGRLGCETVLQAITDTLAEVARQCVLISFSTEFLALARTRTDWPIAAVIDRWDERSAPAIARLQPEFLFCDADGLPVTGDLHAGDGTRLVVYEIDNGRVATELAGRGADMIETFAIGELLRYLSCIEIARPT